MQQIRQKAHTPLIFFNKKKIHHFFASFFKHNIYSQKTVRPPILKQLKKSTTNRTKEAMQMQIFVMNPFQPRINL